MAGRDIIVVGASAGGVAALIELTSSLPAELPAALFVVLHMGAAAFSVLPRIAAERARPRRGAARRGVTRYTGGSRVSYSEHPEGAA